MNSFINKFSLKFFLVCFCLVLSLWLSGCWDRAEINDLAVVVATGIDKGKGKNIEISVEILIPAAMAQEQSKGGGEKTTLLSVQGISVADAMSKLQEKVPRKIFWGHNEVIIFGERFAKTGIRKQMDFFARHPTTRLRPYVYVCKGTAGDILEVAPTLELTSGETLRELATLQVGIRTTAKDVLRNLSGDSQATAIPLIEIAPSRSGKEEGTAKNLRIKGTAIFKQDKMIGHIDDKETRGLQELRNEIKDATITVFPNKEKEEFISFSIVRASTELQSQIKDEKWIMNVKVLVEGDVLQNGTNLNVKEREVVKKLEKKLEEDVRNRIMMVLKPVQEEMSADVIGFAEEFHRRFPKKWKKVKDHWEDVFPTVEVHIDPKVYVHRPGMSTAPQGLPKEERKEK